MSAPSLTGLRVAVAGAGVFGLSAALAASRRGATVVLFDPGRPGDNASSVAAGMLSPALETVLEDGDVSRHALFHHAFGAWTAFEAGLGLKRQVDGSVHVGGARTIAALSARLRDLDVAFEEMDRKTIRDLQPLYGGDQDGLKIGEDARIDTVQALGAMAKAFEGLGGRWTRQRLETGVVPEGFDRLVIATGYDAHAWADFAPELAGLSPVKGHILSYALAGQGGVTLRAEEGYIAPQSDRVAFGATMEAGRADLVAEAPIAARLHASASALSPVLAETPRTVRTGVRASTPDGLPLVGVSAGGPVLAVGARRNGWLLAPLVADAVVEALAGAPPRPAFDPARFGAT